MKLFGPILFYDMIRMGRRSRYILLRCLYALLLLVLMYPIYQTYLDPAGPFAKYADPLKKLTLFGETFFYAFMVAQFVVTVLVTPAYVGGAIADEKHNRTLEYLLVTDLCNREVVLGKFTSRLANLALFLFTGLPVLSLNLLFGGVSVELLWCGFLATTITMLSLAALSILQSVYAKRVRDAMIRTYVIMIGYFALWGLIVLFREFIRLDSQTPALVFTVIDGFLDVYNAGNPMVTLKKLVDEVRSSGSFGMKPFELLGYYSLFHGLAVLSCLLLAILRLRVVFIHQAFGKDGTRKPRSIFGRAPDATDKTKSPWRERLQRPLWQRKRRPVGERPMLWKEYYFERTMRLGVLGELAFALLVLVCFIPMFIATGVALLNLLESGGGVDHLFHGRMNDVVRFVGTTLAGFVIIGTGVRAANSIAAEQNRQTFESLMATPLSNFEILAAKWLGSATSQRWTFGLLLTIWLLATAAMGLHWLALPLVLLALGILVAFMTSLGLALATISKTSGRATAAAIIGFLALSGLPWLVTDGDGGRPAAELLSPPRLLYATAFWQGDYDDWRDSAYRPISPQASLFAKLRSGNRNESTAWRQFRHWRPVLLPVAGLVLYTVAALVLWLLAIGQFKKRCGRVIQRSGGNKSRRPRKYCAEKVEN